jgi:hypothetical protein
MVSISWSSLLAPIVALSAVIRPVLLSMLFCTFLNTVFFTAMFCYSLPALAHRSRRILALIALDSQVPKIFQNWPKNLNFHTIPNLKE